MGFEHELLPPHGHLFRAPTLIQDWPYSSAWVTVDRVSDRPAAWIERAFDRLLA